ncbi:ROK family protein [Streptomyces sp. NPDC059894]|uniref:ROK family protein n=1 Tax=unclassified Streptomyces TaxID=2593676 RepID=UPI0036555A96
MTSRPGYLGIDIGGTKVALRAEHDGTEREGTSIRGAVTHTWAPGPGGAADLAALGGWVREFAAGTGGFTAVGVAVPATVDADGRVTAWPSRPGWLGLDLGAALRAFLPGVPVAWSDDGGLGALAEAAASGCDDVLYVGVGTGVGGGLVLGGVPHPRPGRPAFEIGHLIVRRGGPRCRCGRTGCLQATACGPAVLRRAARLRGAPVTFDELRAGVSAKEAWATRAVDDAGAALASAVVGVTELLHPELALIGGGFAAGVPGFVDAVDTAVRRLARTGFDVPRVRAAAADGLSSLRGALRLARSLDGRRTSEELP